MGIRRCPRWHKIHRSLNSKLFIPKKFDFQCQYQYFDNFGSNWYWFWTLKNFDFDIEYGEILILILILILKKLFEEFWYWYWFWKPNFRKFWYWYWTKIWYCPMSGNNPPKLHCNAKNILTWDTIHSTPCQGGRSKQYNFRGAARWKNEKWYIFPLESNVSSYERTIYSPTFHLILV